MYNAIGEPKLRNKVSVDWGQIVRVDDIGCSIFRDLDGWSFNHRSSSQVEGNVNTDWRVKQDMKPIARKPARLREG